MSIFIHSSDYTSGNSSDGLWEFGVTLKGNYKVVSQVMDTQDYPWMLASQNQMVLQIHDPMNHSIFTNFPVFLDYATIGIITDLQTIADSITTSIQDRIDIVAALPGDSYAARTVTNSIDTSNGTMTFHFDDIVDVLWQGDGSHTFASTCNTALGKTPETPNENDITDLVISTATMVIDPKFLEVYIDESVTEIYNTHDTFPTLLFSTRDTEFTGQTFEIRNETTHLSIGIYKMGSLVPIPLSGQWYLMISPF
jgi:hypothetical protein